MSVHDHLQKKLSNSPTESIVSAQRPSANIPLNVDPLNVEAFMKAFNYYALGSK